MVTQQDYLADNFWNKFNFSNGKIEYMETYLDEDMLQVEYPNKLLLDAGYYSGIFGIEIIWDCNWQTPVAKYICKTQDDFEKLMHIAINQIGKEIEQNRFSYYGPLWETIEISYL
ncbi:MAG: hypothetical protein J6K17_05555 [Oscillospiraceae bacterium]|nr:hypothetical protein [Oscillospiraceae bacterium]